MSSSKKKSSFIIADNLQITFVINSLSSGGAEKQLLLIANQLANAGVRCKIFTIQRKTGSRAIQSLINQCKANGVTINEPQIGYFRYVAFLAKLYFAIFSTQNNLVWTWGTRADFLCKFALRKSGMNTFLSSLRLASEKEILRKRRSYCFRSDMIDGYISNSELNIIQFKKLTHITSSNFHVLRNIVRKQSILSNNLETAQKTFTHQNFLRVALLGNNRYYHKGYDTLLEIAQIVKLNNWPIKFFIAGRDDDKNILQMIKKYAVNDLVTFVGEVTKPIEFLSRHDAFLLTSRTEGTPNSLLEALSLGMPAVATAVGDLKQLFPGQRYLKICDIEGSEQIANQLNDIANNWYEALEMGNRAQRMVENQFCEETVFEDLKNILRSSLNNNLLV